MAEVSDTIQVLLIDEDRFSRAYLRSTLVRRPKIQVLEAESALKGLEILAGTAVDVVIMELVMSDFDGMAMLQLIRTHPASSRAHIAIASSHTLEANVRKAIEMGVTDYLVKPFQPAEVDRRVSALIQRVEKNRRVSADGGGAAERPRVLVADNDLNFCSFVTTTLSSQYDVKQAISSLEILVQVNGWNPDLLLLNPTLRGLHLDFLLDHLWARVSSRGIQVYLLGSEQDLSRPTDRRVSGWMQRTFVPRVISAAAAAILEPSRLNDHNAASWLHEVEPEILSAVQQVFGMMTRIEPVVAEGNGSFDPSLDASLRLHSRRDAVCLVLEFQSRPSFAALLASKLTGMREDEIDQELLGSGVTEVLNVVGGRLLDCCRSHGLHLTMGLPHVGPAEPLPHPPACRWGEHFQWAEREFFSVSLSCFLDCPEPAAL